MKKSKVFIKTISQARIKNPKILVENLWSGNTDNNSNKHTA